MPVGSARLGLVFVKRGKPQMTEPTLTEAA